MEEVPLFRNGNASAAQFKSCMKSGQSREKKGLKSVKLEMREFILLGLEKTSNAMSVTTLFSSVLLRNVANTTLKFSKLPEQ